MMPRGQVFTIEPSRKKVFPSETWSGLALDVNDHRPCYEIFHVFSVVLVHLKAVGVWRGKFKKCSEDIQNPHERRKW